MIVASILLALAADAWWDERQARTEELSILRRLDVELHAAAGHLTEWRSHQVGVSDAGRLILSQTGLSERATLTADSLSELLWTLNVDWTADPPIGVLSSVIATGQLGLIENTDLQAALVRWQSSFGDLRRAEAVTAEMNDRRVIPFLESRLAWRSVVATVGGADLSASTFPLGATGLLADREFEGIVANRVIWVDIVVSKYDELLEDLELTRSIVETAISERR